MLHTRCLISTLLVTSIQYMCMNRRMGSIRMIISYTVYTHVTHPVPYIHSPGYQHTVYVYEQENGINKNDYKLYSIHTCYTPGALYPLSWLPAYSICV